MTAGAVDHLLELGFLSLISIISSFHLIAFLVIDFFTPEWQKHARAITRDVVFALVEADFKGDRS